jgi:hypothetical protein
LLEFNVLFSDERACLDRLAHISASSDPPHVVIVARPSIISLFKR